MIPQKQAVLDNLCGVVEGLRSINQQLGHEAFLRREIRRLRSLGLGYRTIGDALGLNEWQVQQREIKS